MRVARATSGAADTGPVLTQDEELLHNMLAVLGISGSEHSRKQQIEVTSGCFRKPSGKILEHVLHSLFTLITNRIGSKAEKAALKVRAESATCCTYDA